MEITYLAKRSRRGRFYCYDIIADGVYFNLFLSNGSPLADIEQAAEDYLDNPFPDQRVNDTIDAISGSLDTPEPETDPILVFPDGYPDVLLRLVEIEENKWLLEGIEGLLEEA